MSNGYRAPYGASIAGARPRRAGMTLVELSVALGLLTIAVSCLVQVLVAVSDGQQQARNSRDALAKARNVAEDVIRCTGDWQSVCDQYDAQDGVDVAVEDGDGDPDSGWWQVTVRVRRPADADGPAREASLVFGKAGN
ncbi:MAG: type IV pilus modification PilV family protein [Planctomycetota bacterium]